MTVEITVTDLDEAKEVYRAKGLRQALYDEARVMDGVLVNLHGDAHRARRRVENPVFRRDTLAYGEHELFPATIDATLAPHVAAGSAELVSLSHQLMMNLAALNAGIDRPTGDRDETLRLYGQMMRFIEGATVAHSTRDRDEVNGEVATAMDAFRTEFFVPSQRRRRALVAAEAAGEIAAAEVPRDVLAALVRDDGDLGLGDALIEREIAFYLLAGAHTSATAYVRALDHLFAWQVDHPDDGERLQHDPLFVQRCVHETVRLNPSSPVARRRALADVELRSGRTIPTGALVTVDLHAVNRDPSVFGADAERFNPHRRIERADVGPYGLSFGHGMHACIGQELAAGVLTDDDSAEPALLGLATVAVQATLQRGAALDPERAPVWDSTTRRPYWSSYPIRLNGAASLPTR